MTATIEQIVTVWDRVSNPGVARAQELTGAGSPHGVDATASEFHPTTSPNPAPSKLKLTFPIATPNLNIRVLMRVTVGWRWIATRQYLTPADNPPTAPFGGYITKLRERTYGGEKEMECDLSDYGIILKRKRVLGWPTNVRDDPALIGYPPGYSVRDWLIGQRFEGVPYPGIIPYTYGHRINYGGVDPIFDTIQFTPDVMPGGPDGSGPAGLFGFLSVEKVVSALADACLFAYTKNYRGGPPLIIGYWMGALAVGQDIIPRFNFRNQADQNTAPDWQTAGGELQLGEIPVIHPFWHERDAHDVATRVTILGSTGDPTIPGNPLVYADYLNPVHDAVYPTDYPLESGWDLDPVVEPRLYTLATAQFVAQYLESRLWGALGSLTYTVDVPIQVGDRVRFRDENEAIDQIYLCVESKQLANTVGYPLWEIRLGYISVTLNDLLKGGMADVVLIQEDLAGSIWKATGVYRAYPGAPRPVPVMITPVHPLHNVIAPQYRDTAALIVQSTTRQRMLDSGFPDPTPAAQSFMAVGTDGIVRTSTGPQGEPHGHVVIIPFPADGSTPWMAVVSPMTIVRAVWAPASSGVPTFTYTSLAQGVLTIPFTVVRDDEWMITAAGVVGATGSLTVTEIL